MPASSERPHLTLSSSTFFRLVSSSPSSLPNPHLLSQLFTLQLFTTTTTFKTLKANNMADLENGNGAGALHHNKETDNNSTSYGNGGANAYPSTSFFLLLLLSAAGALS